MDALFAIVSTADGPGLIAMFWYLLLFEGPRYLIANFAVAVGAFRPSRTKTAHRDLSVSIILPAHNGARGVLKSIRSLREQTIGRIEIVVVDDGSTDEMAQVCTRLRRQGAIDTFLSNRLRGGKSAALNLGLRHCTGDIVISVDADTTFDRDGVERALRCFADESVGCVGGNVGVRNPGGSLLAALQAVEYAIGISLGRRVSALLGMSPVASGAFSAFRRAALVGVGGWDAGPGEDADVSLKLRRAGWKVGFADDAWALTDAPTTLVALLNQRLRWEADLVRLHLRKFPLVAPWSSHFCIADALTALEVLFFTVGLSLGFFVYVIWLFAAFGLVAAQILLIGGVIYSGIGFATFLLAAGVSRGGRPVLRLAPYALGYGLYCVLVLHPVRVWACIDELLFSRSLRTTFVPPKVLSRIARF